jgi:hypothetical protein
MAGLDHDFLLLSTQDCSYTDYMKWINNPRAIQIPDDVVGYIKDSLNWITCHNPGKRMIKHKGLNWYGPTIIKEDGAIVAHKILGAWATLFSNGPSTLRLTGSYVRIEGEETGSYSVIKIDRDEIVERLTTLADYTNQVAESRDRLFVLHLGI